MDQYLNIVFSAATVRRKLRDSLGHVYRTGILNFRVVIFGTASYVFQDCRYPANITQCPIIGATTVPALKISRDDLECINVSYKRPKVDLSAGFQCWKPLDIGRAPTDLETIPRRPDNLTRKFNI